MKGGYAEAEIEVRKEGFLFAQRTRAMTVVESRGFEESRRGIQWGGNWNVTKRGSPEGITHRFWKLLRVSIRKGDVGAGVQIIPGRVYCRPEQGERSLDFAAWLRGTNESTL